MIECKVIHINNVKIEGDKRQHAPYNLLWKCPHCNKDKLYDFTTDHYIGYPIFGQSKEITLWCDECDNEYQIYVKLDLSLTIVEVKMKIYPIGAKCIG